MPIIRFFFFLFSCLQAQSSDISLHDFARFAFPDISLARIALPDGLPGLSGVFVDHIHVEIPAKRVCVGASVAGLTFNIIPSVVTLRNIHLRLCIRNDGVRTHHSLMVQGEMTIGPVTSVVTIQKMGDKVEASTTIAQVLSVNDVINSFGASFIPEGNVLSRVLDQSGFNSFSLNNTVIIIVRDGQGPANVFITSVAEIGDLRGKVEIVYSGFGLGDPKAAAVFNLTGISLPRIVKKLSGVQLHGLPFLSDLVPPAISLSMASDALRDLPYGFTFTDLLGLDSAIARGITLQFPQEIGGLRKIFRLPLRHDGFEINMNKLPKLNEILSHLFPGVENFDIFRSLSNIIPGVFDLQLSRFAYDDSVRNLTIEASLSKFNLIPNLLEISSSTVRATITKPPSTNGLSVLPNSGLSLSIVGTAKLFTLPLNLEITYDLTTQSFNVRMTSPAGTMLFSKIFDLIGSDILNLVNPVIDGLDLRQSSILNPIFEVNPLSGDLVFRIRGRPTMSGFGQFTVEALASTSPRQLLLTLSVNGFSLAKMIDTLTGLDIARIPFLGVLRGESDIGITLSATHVPRIPFPIQSYPLSEETNIDIGLGLVVAFRLPDACGIDPICKFSRLIIGDQAILLRATEITGPRVRLGYRLPKNLRLGPINLYNVDFGFDLRNSALPALAGLTSIETDIPVPFGGKKLHFKGTMLIDSVSNFEATLRMTGIYERAFGIPILAFGNVDLGFRTHLPCLACFSMLRFGGEIAIGRNCYTGNIDNCIVTQSIFSVDALNADDNYFFFSLNQLSFSKLLTSLGFPNSPIFKLVDIVTIRGVEFSFSPINRNIPSGILPGGKNIKAGLVVKGTVNILFFLNVNIDITVSMVDNVPTSFTAAVSINPITLGPLEFTSASSSRRGPKFVGHASVAPPKFHFIMDARLVISPLGFSTSTEVRIDTGGLFARLSGSIFGFSASFSLTAQFRNVQKPTSLADFHVSGCFSMSLGSRLVHGVKAELEKARSVVGRNLDSAVSALREVDRKLAQAVDVFNLKNGAEEAVKQTLRKAEREVRNAQSAINKLCKIRNCDRKLKVPKPCIVQRCNCVLPYPCCRRWSCKMCCQTVCVPLPSFCGSHSVNVPDPVCLSQNVICHPIRAAAFLARKAAELVVSTASAGVSAAAAATDLASKAVKKARLLSRSAEVVKSGVQLTFDAITSAITAIFTTFRVNEVCFDVGIGSVIGARIRVSLELVVLGSTHRFSATLNLKNILDFARNLARRFFKRFF